ncbi:MAG TPA: hypothetical protein VIR03_03775 [Candidatus Saccharimonadales bacterium]
MQWPPKFELPKLPDLHHIGGDGLADWERIPPEEWTPVQQRAADTHGVDTPGNRETLKGIVGTGIGLGAIAFGYTALGLAGVTYGRWRDMRDGKRADETQTKSPLGEAFDATTDNALLAAAMPILEAKGMLSLTDIAMLGGVVALKFVGAGLAKVRGVKIHPPRIAKLGMFGQWSGVTLRIGAQAFKEGHLDALAEGTRILSDATLYAGIGAAGMAGAIYAGRSVRRKRKGDDEATAVAEQE